MAYKKLPNAKVVKCTETGAIGVYTGGQVYVIVNGDSKKKKEDN